MAPAAGTLDLSDLGSIVLRVGDNDTPHRWGGQVQKGLTGTPVRLTAVQGRGLRWGGDFSPADPVHFDDYVDPNGEDFDMNYYFAQRAYQQQHPMRQV